MVNDIHGIRYTGKRYTWQKDTLEFTEFKNGNGIYRLIQWAQSFQSDVLLNYGIRA